MLYRILLDQDSVLYDLHTPWLAAHNADFPNHDLRIEHHKGWDANQACRDNNCHADVYTYFNSPALWTDGLPIGNSVEITRRWLTELPVELGVITTAANAMSMPYKIEWLQRYFPHIHNVMIVHKAHIKHWLDGHILIDDGVHNLEHFKGMGICYDQPWNRCADMLRARNWDDVDRLVREAISLFNDGSTPAQAEEYMYSCVEGSSDNEQKYLELRS